MKCIIMLLLFFFCQLTISSSAVIAQEPITEVIKKGIKKIIVAVDLRIQRLQNQTIWLQNAQKTLENAMSKLRLTEISEWVERQRELYASYFEELWKVKALITYYHRVKDIVERQVQLVNEYKAAWSLFQQDKHFTPDELEYMYEVYTGIFDESIKSIDRLLLVVNAFTTQMSDGKRLEIINGVADELEERFRDLREFNNQNKMLSLQRASDQADIDYIRKLYGL